MSNAVVFEKEESFRQSVYIWKFKSDWFSGQTAVSDFFALPSPHSKVRIRIKTAAIGGCTFLEAEGGESFPDGVDIKLIYLAGVKTKPAIARKGNGTVAAHTSKHFEPDGFSPRDWSDLSVDPERTVHGNTIYGYTIRCVITVKESDDVGDSMNTRAGLVRVPHKRFKNEIFPEPVVKMQRKTTTTDGLAEAFEKLFRKESFSDAVIKVQGKTIKVTRAILAARSPVFCDMLKNMPTELIIKNVDYESLMVVIEFIYSDRCEDVSKLTLDVLVAAGKYNVPGLMALAEDHLAKNLSNENIEKALVVAKQHNLTNFLNRCMKFVAANDLGFEMTSKLLNRLV